MIICVLPTSKPHCSKRIFRFKEHSWANHSRELKQTATIFLCSGKCYVCCFGKCCRRTLNNYNLTNTLYMHCSLPPCRKTILDFIYSVLLLNKGVSLETTNFTLHCYVSLLCCWLINILISLSRSVRVSYLPNRLSFCWHLILVCY